MFAEKQEEDFFFSSFFPPRGGTGSLCEQRRPYSICHRLKCLVVRKKRVLEEAKETFLFLLFVHQPHVSRPDVELLAHHYALRHVLQEKERKLQRRREHLTDLPRLLLLLLVEINPTRFDHCLQTCPESVNQNQTLPSPPSPPKLGQHPTRRSKTYSREKGKEGTRERGKKRETYTHIYTYLCV